MEASLPSQAPPEKAQGQGPPLASPSLGQGHGTTSRPRSSSCSPQRLMQPQQQGVSERTSALPGMPSEPMTVVLPRTSCTPSPPSAARTPCRRPKNPDLHGARCRMTRSSCQCCQRTKLPRETEKRQTKQPPITGPTTDVTQHRHGKCTDHPLPPPPPEPHIARRTRPRRCSARPGPVALTIADATRMTPRRPPRPP